MVLMGTPCSLQPSSLTSSSGPAKRGFKPHEQPHEQLCRLHATRSTMQCYPLGSAPCVGQPSVSSNPAPPFFYIIHPKLLLPRAERRASGVHPQASKGRAPWHGIHTPRPLKLPRAHRPTRRTQPNPGSPRTMMRRGSRRAAGAGATCRRELSWLLRA